MGVKDLGGEPLRCDGRRCQVHEDCQYPYVETGYRLNVRSVAACLSTLFMSHNETVNVWTHMMGGAWFVLFVMDNLDSPPVALAGLGTAACMALSVAYHLFSCLATPHGVRCLLCADQSGIFLATCANTLSGLYVAFSCTPETRDLYIIVDAAVIGGLAALKFLGAPVSNVLFLIVFAGIGIVPAFHWLCCASTATQMRAAGANVAMMWVWFGLGLTFYTTCWPERHFPRRFDLWGASHQLFHVCVFMGLRAILLAIDAVDALPLDQAC